MSSSRSPVTSANWRNTAADDASGNDRRDAEGGRARRWPASRPGRRCRCGPSSPLGSAPGETTTTSPSPSPVRRRIPAARSGGPDPGSGAGCSSRSMPADAQLFRLVWNRSRAVGVGAARDRRARPVAGREQLAVLAEAGGPRRVDGVELRLRGRVLLGPVELVGRGVDDVVAGAVGGLLAAPVHRQVPRVLLHRDRPGAERFRRRTRTPFGGDDHVHVRPEIDGLHLAAVRARMSAARGSSQAARRHSSSRCNGRRPRRRPGTASAEGPGPGSGRRRPRAHRWRRRRAGGAGSERSPGRQVVHLHGRGTMRMAAGLPATARCRRCATRARPHRARASVGAAASHQQLRDEHDECQDSTGGWPRHPRRSAGQGPTGPPGSRGSSRACVVTPFPRANLGRPEDSPPAIAVWARAAGWDEGFRDRRSGRVIAAPVPARSRVTARWNRDDRARTRIRRASCIFRASIVRDRGHGGGALGPILMIRWCP